MKNEELKKLAGEAEFKKVTVEEDLNTVFIRQGKVAIDNLIEKAGLVELEEVENIPLLNIPMAAESETEQAVEIESESNPKGMLRMVVNEPESDEWDEQPRLEILHENKMRMRGRDNFYYILGSVGQDMASLFVTLMVEEISTGRKDRSKVDLYERNQLDIFIQQVAGVFAQQQDQIEMDVSKLTDLLEQYREKQIEATRSAFPYNKRKLNAPLPLDKQQQFIQFLSEPDLMPRIDKLIGQAGVVGEENTRRLLFVVASTYKMNTPLHGLVQGSSGSGKSHLINIIGGCFPSEDVISMTRVTSKSFYHYTKDELVDKLILIQDYDGLDEEAQYAFRELQTNGSISSSTTYKDRYGNLMSAVKTVRSHFASLLATTKAEIYFDNMSRSMIIGVDESEEQTLRIIHHQNKRLAGHIDSTDEKKAKEFLQHCIRLIKPMEVINPYAEKVSLPFEAKMLRRLNSHYQAFVKQITILHQYQRKKDDRGRLIAQPEDLKIACEILFDAIMLKVDELDSSLRQFFDLMKTHIKKLANGEGTPEDFRFTQRDVRLKLNVSKTQCFRYFEQLELLEYIQRTGGYANRGFKYKIVYWDDMEKTRDKIKTALQKQLEVLSGSTGLEHQNPQLSRD
jgi:energy-coupling factor transporter ATP-binding protein EcfA2